MIDRADAGTTSYLIIALLFLVLFIQITPIHPYLLEVLKNLLRYQIRGKLIHHVLSMDQSFHDGRGSTKLVEQIRKGVDASTTLIREITNGNLLVRIPVAIFAIGYIGTHSSTIAFLLIIGIILFVFLGKAFGQAISKYGEEYNDLDNDMMHRQREVVEEVSVIKVHNAQETEMKHYWSIADRGQKLLKKLVLLNLAIDFSANAIGLMASFAIILVFIPEVTDGNTTIGTFLALYMYANFVVQPATMLGEMYADIKKADAALTPIMEIMGTKAQVIEQENPLQLNPLRDGIELSNIHFRYPDKDADVLTGFSLTIPAKKRTAIVGGSGAGKTTIAQLLLRLYDPNMGIIRFDGTDIRNVSLASLYDEIAYLPQQIPIFTGTVRDNVGFGRTSVSDDDVRSALKQSAADFVFDEKDSINMRVGERGRKLSGGEAQRIALAQIFMQNPSIIILDEATSALDNITEHHIHKMLESLASEKTVIIIAHRLSTVRSADQIVVMRDGQILDVGTHEELLDRCGYYQELNETFVE